MKNLKCNSLNDIQALLIRATSIGFNDRGFNDRGDEPLTTAALVEMLVDGSAPTAVTRALKAAYTAGLGSSAPTR